MAKEIEIKARLGNPEAILKKLSGLATHTHDFEKEDAYWHDADKRRAVGRSGKSGQPSQGRDYGIRVRREKKTIRGKATQKNYVTWKSKETRGGVEFNSEKEFEVSSVPFFEELLTLLGFAAKSVKRKRGSSWRRDDITLEVTDIENLG